MKRHTIWLIAIVMCSGNLIIAAPAFSPIHHRGILSRNIINPADTMTLAGAWYLQPVLPSDTAAGKIPSLFFHTSTNRFTGNTGCNRMSGTFRHLDSSLVFSQRMVMTKMLCTGYNERAFVESLLRTNHYKFENGMLVLMAGTTELSRWARKPPQAPRVIKT